MQVYCVSFALTKSAQNHPALCEELKNSHDWLQCLDSTWLILTSETASQVFDRLKPHVDNSDRMLVIGVTSDYSGWLTPDAWTWIVGKVSKERR